MNFLIFVAALVIGYILIRYSKWIVDTSGIRFSWFENSLGPGASYSVWKLFGLALICFGFWVLFGGIRF
jgi:hypothetical protein